MLKDKKVLLIAPLFFGYYSEIEKELQGLGAEVDYICDAPSNSNISKAVGRINKNFIKNSTELYFKNSVVPVVRSKKYDYVFLVAGMTFAFSQQMMKFIREIQDNAIFVMYQWDSQRNLPYSLGIHEFFDRIFSFDRFDCADNKSYSFLPLFYTANYERIPKIKETETIYDCSYIGTAHARKYKDITEMSRALQQVMPNQYIYQYMPSVLKFFYQKIMFSDFRTARYSDFKTEKVSSEETMKVFEQSKCILDAPQAGQTGLTIRTIECLGARRKLITTNGDIVNYNFYKPENIYVFNGVIDDHDSFFTTDYSEIDDRIYQSYSLRNWLGAMLY